MKGPVVGKFKIGISLLTAAILATNCKVEEANLPTSVTASDEGTGSFGDGSGSSALTAPVAADPLPGATIHSAQPTLTVLNSAHEPGAQTTYLFQVSPDEAFASLLAQSPQVAEGADGTTAWSVDRSLEDGRYYWRARARAGTSESDFSAVADFVLSEGGGTSENPPAPPSPTPAGTILFDPLIGGSIGEVSGGQFVSGGWQVTHPANYIRYEIPPSSDGYVEFDVMGLREVNSTPDQFMLFGMWDPSAGAYRANPFRVHLQKLHPNPHNPPWLRLRWIANGEQHDRGSNFLAWDPFRTYHFRIEWGPSGGGNQVRVFLDGSLEITVNYNRSYSPNVHWLELGIAERGESVVGATYTNFRVGR